jgi:LysM repeat protein/phage tail protein X
MEIGGSGTWKRPSGWKIAVLAGLLPAALSGCTYGEPSTALASAKPATTAETAVATVGKSSLTGTPVADSFGNIIFYTTVPGDTSAAVAAEFDISEAKLNGFNGLEPAASLKPGTKLRLIPVPGPIKGAKGTATVDENGIPTSYIIEPGDTLGGITYRFGITEEQLAEANKVPYVYEKGNTYFVRSGHLIQLQKNPVDSRSGAGKTINNSFGQTIYYTTVDGDSFDSLGYKFRSTTEQILLYNPSLEANEPIPAGTEVRLIPGELKIDGAQGSFTAGDDGIPLTYTTAPGDTERQVAFRFAVTDLRAANRPSTGTGGAWYEFTASSPGEFAPGQTISLALNKPINKPAL